MASRTRRTTSTSAPSTPRGRSRSTRRRSTTTTSSLSGKSIDRAEYSRRRWTGRTRSGPATATTSAMSGSWPRTRQRPASRCGRARISSSPSRCTCGGTFPPLANDERHRPQSRRLPRVRSRRPPARVSRAERRRDGDRRRRRRLCSTPLPRSRSQRRISRAAWLADSPPQRLRSRSRSCRRFGPCEPSKRRRSACLASCR